MEIILLIIIIIVVLIKVVGLYYEYIGHKEEQAAKAEHYRIYKNRNFNHKKNKK
ncbi:MAG: hypothetical protein J0H76_09470 [Sphingobacteriales bacterium]|nr:hypothetical protein [Sphingobacteriales bacterium]